MIVAMGNIAPDATDYIEAGYNVQAVTWSDVSHEWTISLAGIELYPSSYVVVATSIAYATNCYWYFTPDGKLEVHCFTDNGIPTRTGFSFVVFEVA